MLLRLMDVACSTSKCALLGDDPILQHRIGMWKWRFCWWKAFIAALLLCNIVLKVIYNAVSRHFCNCCTLH